MEKEIWKTCFHHQSYISYPCPSCGIGVLNPIQNKVLGQVFEKPLSSNYDAALYYENGEKKVFTAILSCNNNKCQQAAGMVGEYLEGCPEWSDDAEEMVRMNLYLPKYIHPNLKMFRYPSTVPLEIKHEIDSSFSNFFCDPSSAANKIRRAIELIVTNLGIPKSFVNKKVLRETGKRKLVPAKLHARIERLKKRKKRTGKMLLGLKVLGNDGSHSNNKEISHWDILDAYEVLEHILDREYSNKENEILRMAERLENRKQ